MAPTSQERSLSTTVQADTIFQEITLFADLSGRSRRRLMARCVPRSYAAGAQILEEGDRALGLFLIGSGEVEVFKTEDGQRVSLARLRAGDILGEMALFDQAPRSASAEAVRDTECLLLTRNSFHAAVEEEPEILLRIVPRLAQRLRDTQDRLVELEVAEEGPEGAVEGREGPALQPSATQGPAVSPAAAFQAQVLAQVQAQHALAVAGTEGVAASARLLAGFLGDVAEEVELSRQTGPGTLLGRLPEALVRAGRRVLPEAEKIPEKVLDRALLQLRRNRRGEG